MEWTECLKELNQLIPVEACEWEEYRCDKDEPLARRLAEIVHRYIYENFGLDPDPHSFGWIETIAPQLAHFGLLSPMEEKLCELYNTDRQSFRELLAEMYGCE